MRIQNHETRLSTRESEVIELIVQECSTKEIAQRLYISDETVKSHRKKIMQKLQVRNVAGIVREALLQNLLAKYSLAS